MNPEEILAQTVKLLTIARRNRAKPERIEFLELEVRRMTAEVAHSNPHRPTPRRGEGRLGNARTSSVAVVRSAASRGSRP